MAGEAVANVQSGAAAILSVTPSSAGKSKAAEENTDKFSDVLGSCDAKENVKNNFSNDKKAVDDEKPEEEAVLMAGYVPFVNRIDSENVDNIDVNEAVSETLDAIDVLQNINSVQVLETAVNTEAPQEELVMDDAMVELSAENISEEADFTDIYSAIGSTEASDENVSQFMNFINTTEVQAKDIESVKFMTLGQRYGGVGKIEALDRMENLIQKVFFGAEEENVDETEDKKSEEDEVPKTELGEEIKETARIIAEENTDGDAKVVEPSVEPGKVVEVKTVEALEGIADGGDMNSDADAQFGENEENDFGELIEKNSQSNISKTNAFGIAQTEAFKLYDVDTNINVPQQINRIMQSTFTTKGWMDDVQGTKEMELQLNPESLGRIIIKMQSVGGVLDIKISATNAEVREMLTAQMNQLTMTIKEQGVEVGNMEVAQSALQNNKEESNNNGERQQKRKSEQDNDDEESIDFNAVKADVEAALSALGAMA